MAKPDRKCKDCGKLCYGRTCKECIKKEYRSLSKRTCGRNWKRKRKEELGFWNINGGRNETRRIYGNNRPICR